MTTKKPTTKKPAARRTLKERARAIIDNAEGHYDDSTCEAISNSLNTKHSDLQEFVRRAERGEVLCDLTSTRIAAAVPLDDLPGLLAAVLMHSELPERIYIPIADTLLSMAHNLNYFTPEVIRLTFAHHEQEEAMRQKGGRK
jgi:hypothetical protein